MIEFKLNNPKALNSVNIPLLDTWHPKLKEIFGREEDYPRVIMMSGAGSKAFCVGGDIVSVAHFGNKREKFLEYKEKIYSLHATFASMLPT